MKRRYEKLKISKVLVFLALWLVAVFCAVTSSAWLVFEIDTASNSSITSISLSIGTKTMHANVEKGHCFFSLTQKQLFSKDSTIRIMPVGGDMGGGIETASIQWKGVERARYSFADLCVNKAATETGFLLQDTVKETLHGYQSWWRLLASYLKWPSILLWAGYAFVLIFGAFSSRSIFDEQKYFVIAILVGTICYASIYGWSTLDVQYDRWLFSAYAESDNIQHYAGWVAFRNASWNFPIGKMENIGYPVGMYLSFMDSIPLLGIFFKLIRTFLPTTFQYFGGYVFLCFLLQAYAAVKIFGLYITKNCNLILSTALITFSPIMIERAYRHTALASHFLIIFSLYIYFKSKKCGHSCRSWWYVLLSVLCVTIHPYFLPMVMGIMFATLLDDLIYNHNWKRFCLIHCTAILSSLAVCYALGIFSSHANLAQGYGVFCLNLNSLFNPTSTNLFRTGSQLPTYHWSNIIPELSQNAGNYDGFAYLGLGLLIFLFFAGALVIYDYCKQCKWGRKTKQYFSICVVSLLFTAFAISNTITCYDNSFHIPLPDIVIQMAGIFAASARIFYPVYYLLCFWVLIEFNNLNLSWLKRKKIICLLLVLAIQCWDLSGICSLKYNYFRDFLVTRHVAYYDGCAAENQILWNKIGKYYNKAYVLEAYRSYGYVWTLEFAAQNLFTNHWVGNRISVEDRQRLDDYANGVYAELLSGKIDKKALYVTNDPAKIAQLQPLFSSQASFISIDTLPNPIVILLPNQ